MGLSACVLMASGEISVRRILMIVMDSPVYTEHVVMVYLCLHVHASLDLKESLVG